MARQGRRLDGSSPCDDQSNALLMWNRKLTLTLLRDEARPCWTFVRSRALSRNVDQQKQPASSLLPNKPLTGPAHPVSWLRAEGRCCVVTLGERMEKSTR